MCPPFMADLSWGVPQKPPNAQYSQYYLIVGLVVYFTFVFGVALYFWWSRRLKRCRRDAEEENNTQELDLSEFDDE